jgi:FMN-dependent dehydrogenase
MLPPGVYDYYAGGAGRERTLRANEKAWRQVWLTPAGSRWLSAARPDPAPRVTQGRHGHTVEE